MVIGAHAALLQRQRLSRWGLGVLAHGLWALAMLAALASLLLMLATRRYGFVWETTILGGDSFIALTRALGAVHFEQIRVEPDGRAVIRHMGGSLVWLLFPPMTRPIAISDEQVRATVDAIEAFAAAGRRAAAG